jgi:hypothetical protein
LAKQFGIINEEKLDESQLEEYKKIIYFNVISSTYILINICNKKNIKTDESIEVKFI